MSKNINKKLKYIFEIDLLKLCFLMTTTSKYPQYLNQNTIHLTVTMRRAIPPVRLFDVPVHTASTRFAHIYIMCQWYFHPTLCPKWNLYLDRMFRSLRRKDVSIL